MADQTLDSKELKPDAPTLYKFAQRIAKHEPGLFEYFWNLSQHATFVYNEEDDLHSYVEQLEQFLLQTLDTGKHFATRRVIKDKKAVAVPTLDEINRHLSVSRGPTKQKGAAQNFNALLRLILSGHSVTFPQKGQLVVTLFGNSSQGSIIEYNIVHTFNGKTYRLHVSSTLPDAPGKAKIEMYENDSLKHLFLYNSYNSVFSNTVESSYGGPSYIIHNHRYEQSDDNLMALTRLDEDGMTNERFINLTENILPWLAEFFFKGELPMYKEQENGTLATVRTYADLTLKI